jgi:hypothetical protein
MEQLSHGIAFRAPSVICALGLPLSICLSCQKCNASTAWKSYNVDVDLVDTKFSGIRFVGINVSY